MVIRDRSKYFRINANRAMKVIDSALAKGCAITFKPGGKNCVIGEVIGPDKTPYACMGLDMCELLDDMAKMIERVGNKVLISEPIDIEPDE